MRRFRLHVPIVPCLVACLASSNLLAQVARTSLDGTVVDEQGKRLPAAKVKAINKRKAIADLLTGALTDGQNLTQQLVYAPQPTGVASKELAAVSKIQ
jgi:hypothetical protein